MGLLRPDTGLWWRGHSGPKLGEGVGVGCQEKSDGSLTLDYWIENNEDLPLDELRKVAVGIEAAADWIEAHPVSAKQGPGPSQKPW